MANRRHSIRLPIGIASILLGIAVLLLLITPGEENDTQQQIDREGALEGVPSATSERRDAKQPRPVRSEPDHETTSLDGEAEEAEEPSERQVDETGTLVLELRPRDPILLDSIAIALTSFDLVQISKRPDHRFDSNFELTFNDLLPARYEVYLFFYIEEPGATRWIEATGARMVYVRAGETTTETVSAPLGGRISGTFPPDVSEAVTISLACFESSLAAGRREPQRTAHGSFEFRGLPPGGYRLIFREGERASIRHAYVFPGSLTDLGEVRLAEPPDVAVQVHDDHGGIDGLSLDVTMSPVVRRVRRGELNPGSRWSLHSQRAQQRTLSGTTDGQGMWRVKEIFPSHATIRVYDEPGGMLLAQRTGVRIGFHPSQRIAIRLGEGLDEEVGDREPAPNLRLTAPSSLHGEEFRLLPAYSFGDRKRIELGEDAVEVAVRPGDYRLVSYRQRADACVGEVIRWFRVEGEGITDVMIEDDLHFADYAIVHSDDDELARLRIRITRRRGQPLDRLVATEARRVDGDEAVTSFGRFPTGDDLFVQVVARDANGRFLFRQVLASTSFRHGPVRLDPELNGQIYFGSGGQEIRFIDRRAATDWNDCGIAEILVRDSRGRAMPGVPVVARAARQGRAMAGEARTDENGVARIERLESNRTYNIRVSGFAGQNGTAQARLHSGTPTPISVQVGLVAAIEVQVCMLASQGTLELVAPDGSSKHIEQPLLVESVLLIVPKQGTYTLRLRSVHEGRPILLERSVATQAGTMTQAELTLPD